VRALNITPTRRWKTSPHERSGRQPAVGSGENIDPVDKADQLRQ
jgi:hypothetical protein